MTNVDIIVDGLLVLILVASGLVALLAGFVKGAVGFAMPMIMISGISSFVSPAFALAALIIPTLLSNLWQALRQGPRSAMDSARVHWRYLAIMLGMILVTAQFVSVLDPKTFLLILGIPITLFAIVQLVGWRPVIGAGKRRPVEAVVAAISGAIGGVSGVWGPPTVLYLTALGTPKTEQVRVQGVLYGAGAIMLTLAHLRSGVLTVETGAISALLAVPALFGMWLGFLVQDRLDQALFRKITLVVLVLAGLNLVRRGLGA